MTSRVLLDREIDSLAAQMPQFGDGQVAAQERAGEWLDRAIELSQAAGPEDAEYIDRRLMELLSRHGLLSSDPRFDRRLGQFRAATR